MPENKLTVSLLLATLAFAPLAFAGDDPAHERHELMEGVKDAAKPLGQMLKGERDYDLDLLVVSLETFAEAGETFGDLFPDGSEGGEAAPAIWEDRAGFDDALGQWREATDAALAARPDSVEAAKPLLGDVFGACKNCHDTYRIEEE